MKPLLVAALTILGAAALPATARADDYSTNPGNYYNTPEYQSPPALNHGQRFTDNIHVAQRLKRAGIAATIIGTGMAVAGAAVFGAAYRDHSDWEAANSAGAALLVAGGLGITGGIPMWVVGARAEKRDEARLRLGASATGVYGSF